MANLSKKQKRGKKGSAAQYLTRTQALRKLQVRLPEFRRLCILKGIHPREPRKKPKGASKTYYHVKDLAFLMHEPLLATFRDARAHQKKVNRARAKRQLALAEQLASRAPQYTLDRLVRERYASFADAVRDLDDPLCMAHLFAALPASKAYHIAPDTLRRARALCVEWQAWVVRTRSLRKVFVAVKGFYYQAEVSGYPVTWLVPHERGQVLPSDVDYRVMLTFLEFYDTMLRFVLFKLYADEGMPYPPRVAESKNSAAAGRKPTKAEEEDDVPARAGGTDLGALLASSPSASPSPGSASEDGVAGGLFSGCVFYLARETPRESLLFVISSLGGAAGWDGEGAPLGIARDDPSVTHVIVDRPLPSSSSPTPGKTGEKGREEGREVVQPQWVYDSANAGVLVPVALYGPGSSLPPHLSPFVDDEKEGYVPEYAEVIKQLQSQQSVPAVKARGGGGEEGMEGEEEGMEGKGREGEGEGEGMGGERLQRRHQAELREELGVVDMVGGGVGSLMQSVGEEDEEADGEGMVGAMLSRKDRKLLDAIQRSKMSKRERVAALAEKRKKIKKRKQQHT